MSSRRLLLAAATLCVSLLITLVLGEILLRLAGVETTLVYRPDPYYGWGHTPGHTFNWETKGKEQHIRINALGLRDDDYPYEKPGNTNRTLILGDSFAEGLQVSLEERFSNLVEEALNDSTSNPERHEVINAGVSGYGTDNSLLFFRQEGFKYDPDLVILAFYVGNDVRNNWYPLENRDTGGFRKPYFELVNDRLELRAYPFSKHSSFGTRVKIFLNRHLVLYSFLREIRDRIRHSDSGEANSDGTGVPLDLQIYESDPGPEWEKAFAITKALLTELQTEVYEHDARFLVVLIPSRLQVYSDQWGREVATHPKLRSYEWDLNRPNRILTGFMKDNGIDCLDLLPAFRAAARSGKTDLYIIGDGHWTVTGHREAAEQIARRIILQDLDRADE